MTPGKLHVPHDRFGIMFHFFNAVKKVTFGVIYPLIFVP